MMSLGGFTSDASLHCLFVSSIFSFSASICEPKKERKINRKLRIKNEGITYEMTQFRYNHQVLNSAPNVFI